jgi:CMP-2-keto-3-deoxyoctulosonic acid synthetase
MFVLIVSDVGKQVYQDEHQVVVLTSRRVFSGVGRISGGIRSSAASTEDMVVRPAGNVPS